MSKTFQKKRKRYNKETKGYKIDIFASLLDSNRYVYVGSTDMSKTCKEAKKRYIELNSIFCKNKKIKTYFDYNYI